jgi:signal transduction histidine kinase
VSSELLQTQERERRQIAIEIHDRIGQALAVTKIQLGALTAMLENPAKLAAVEDIRKLITQAIQDTRTLTFELSPPVLYELGLQAALEWLAETIQAQNGLQVFVAGNQNEESLDTSRKVFLFRVVRELLFNVLKHAEAQKVHVQVSKAAESIYIQVTDDGRGIDPHCLNAQDSDANQDHSFGLFSIREQLRHYNGQLTLKAKEGKGTCATISMPLETSV